MKRKVALIVGHRPDAPGAVSRDGLTEYDYNSKVVARVAELLRESSVVEPVIVHRGSYATLPNDVNATGADFAISFHANGYSNALATGTEALYWHSSTKGAAMAAVLLREMLQALGLRDRGIKPITSGERGSRILKGTAMPCVIVEPFFLTNQQDKQIAVSKQDALVDAYVRAITQIAEQLV